MKMLKLKLNQFRESENAVEQAVTKLARDKVYLTDEIRAERLRQGITLREFAIRVGITAAYLSDLELGRRFPAEKNLIRIIESLNQG